LNNKAVSGNGSQNGAVPKNGDLPDTHFYNGPIPQSVAGSGISPSAPDQGKTFSLNEPQTSLPDPHFANGQIPASVAGSGISPSDKSTELTTSATPTKNVNTSHPFAPTPFNFDTISSFEQELQQVLTTIKSVIPGAQLPGVPDFSEPSFYFLGGKQLFQPPGSKGIPGHVQAPFDVNKVRADFPILQQRINGQPLIWLDNAATTQKPQQVIDRISHFYETENSNIHRAAHELAARATDAYESARKKVQDFLHASSVNEIVFVRGSTEAINLVAQSWGDQYLKAGDEIIVSHLEHHANIVP
jgi:cysteine desulfurase/selenocysteine lyase